MRARVAHKSHYVSECDERRGTALQQRRKKVDYGVGT